MLHHGKMTGEFEPRYTSTDYFAFYHKPCDSKCEITAILIDNRGRIVFNLKCRKCGAVDALKTSPTLYMSREVSEPLERFHLSPKLKNRVKKHEWDDA